MRASLRDALTVASDNLQRNAQLQLQQTFELAKCKGAYAMLNLEAKTNDLDYEDANLLQQPHVEALQELRRYGKAMDDAIGKRTGNSQSKNARKGNSSNFRGGGGHGRFRGNNRGNNGGGWRNTGGSRGGWSQTNDNRNNSNNNDNKPK